MNSLHLAFRNLPYHWRTNSAVALGVLAATAVLTGALVVGDSMQGSLRHLVLDRLGSIDEVLIVPRMFREQLASDLANDQELNKRFSAFVPAIVMQGTLETTSVPKHRAGEVNVLGSGAEFWRLGSHAPSKPPTGDDIVLNEPLAAQLRAKVGDEIVLRLPQVSAVPADSPLGRKTETVRSHRFKVSEIIPAEGLGRFGVRPTQQQPLNAYTSLAPLEQMIDVEGRVNAIFVGGSNENIPDAASEQLLQAALKPNLADYGLSVHQTDRGYFNITTDRMVLEPAIEATVLKAFPSASAQPVFTYLANYILAGDGRGKIPYSTVAAIDFTAEPPLGPFLNRQGKPIPPLADDEIVLNSWAADDLVEQGVELKPGDTIELTYFEPESTHGKVVETRHKFQLKDVAELAGAAADRNLTPEVKGVTDEASIANWDPPFPYDKDRVRTIPPKNQDDLYWKQYRATPKAFINLKQGQSLWGSRFGDATSIRIPQIAEGNPAVKGGSDKNESKPLTKEAIVARLERQFQPADLGFAFLPVKRLSLTAAAGTTPFAILFLAFSLFIIVAALMLVMLLFKLSVDTRATELGIILALGLRRGLARRMLLMEGICIALVGALAGIVAGIGYAWLMLVGLKTWWLGAISTAFLALYVQLQSLLIGFACGLLASLATIVWALRQTRRTSVRRLMSGHAEEFRPPLVRRWRVSQWIALGLAVAAVACSGSAFQLGGEAQAGAFMGAGALVLSTLLIAVWNWIRTDHNLATKRDHSTGLLQLAIRSAARNPLRSTLTIGLTAAACFLIVAVSAFQLDPPRRGPSLDSGDGGFALVAQSDQPIFQDLNSTAGREDLGFSDRAQSKLQLAVNNSAPHPRPSGSLEGEAGGAEIISLRVQAGDDASCLNLYQPRQPRVLGVSEEFIHRGGFAWAAAEATTPEEKQNPWLLLDRVNKQSVAKSQSIDQTSGNADTSSTAFGKPIPVVLDQNTATYSLHLGEGTGQVFEIDRPGGGNIKLQVVGLLSNSIFQGDLLVSEANFLKLFPETNGYRLFLIAASPQNVNEVAEVLDSTLSDYGFNAQTTASRLATLFAVQNTYLATFRSLGGLGLLLGTFGVAAVQLRSIVERRGELALMQAIGFRRRRLALLVLLEQAALLVAGLAIGALAALATLIPHLLVGGAFVPWISIAATLGSVLMIDLLVGTIAVRAMLKEPVLAALRGT